MMRVETCASTTVNAHSCGGEITACVAPRAQIVAEGIGRDNVSASDTGGRYSSGLSPTHFRCHLAVVQAEQAGAYGDSSQGQP